MEAAAVAQRLLQLERDRDAANESRRKAWDRIVEVEKTLIEDRSLIKQLRDDSAATREDIRSLKRWVMTAALGLMTTGGSLIVGLLVGSPK